MKITIVFSVVLLFGLFFITCDNSSNPIETSQDQNLKLPQVVSCDDEEPGCGRMTGGGSVFMGDGTRVTRGFELHCCDTEPNNLQVNWRKGNKFHLLDLTYTFCDDLPGFDPEPPTAGFDTFYGKGYGRLNGVPGAWIEFEFQDHGEPGDEDWASIEIWDSDAKTNKVLEVEGYIDRGNLQAH